MRASIKDCATEVNEMSIRSGSRNLLKMTMLFGISLAAATASIEALAEETERASASRHITGGRDNPTATSESKAVSYTHLRAHETYITISYAVFSV